MPPRARFDRLSLLIGRHGLAGAAVRRLRRLALTLVAAQGNALELEATAFVPATEEWGDTPAVIGYHCCLDRLVFAVDGPKELLYFGDASGSL